MRGVNILNSRSFKRLSLSLYQYPLRALGICLLIFMALASQLGTITIDTSTEGFLAKDSAKIQRYNAFLNTYERDEMIMLTLEKHNIFSIEFFAALSALHQQLESTLPYVKEVDSLLNARNVYGKEDELLIEDLVEVFPQTADEMNKIKAFAVDNPLYVNRYLSRDHTFTTLFVRLKGFYRNAANELLPLSDEIISAELQNLKAIVAQHEPTLGHIYISGSPVITEALKQNIKHDMRRFTLLTLVIVLLLLAIVFRRLSMVLLPLLIVIPSVVLTFSLMAIAAQPIQTPVTILPSFLLAMGVCDAIHFLNAFLRAFRLGGNKKRAMLKAMQQTSIPMLLTSLTTAAGLLSFATAGIVPIANLGIFAAVGVLIAFVLTVVLLPVALSLISIKRPDGKVEVAGWYDRAIARLVEVIGRRAKAVVLAFTLLLAFSVYSISLLEFSHNPLKWFPEDAEVRVATELVGEKMGGVIPVELLLDTGKENGVNQPAFLQALNAFVEELNQMAGVDRVNVEFKASDTAAIGKVIAVTDMVKEVNRALHADDPVHYRIPDNAEQIAQEFILVEMGNADDLFQLTDRRYRVARVTVMSPWLDATSFPGLQKTIMDSYRHHLSALSNIEMTGIIPILMQTMNELIRTTAVSYTLAFVLISMMMVLLMRSVKYGLVAMIPNLLPVAVILAAMYWFDIPLDMFTLLVGTIAIGLAVDDTIHFMHSFRQRLNAGHDVKTSIQLTLSGAGRAMLITTAVLAAGFLVFTQSQMSNLTYFGLLTGACIILALVSDFVLAPALMVVMHGTGSGKAGAGKKAALVGGAVVGVLLFVFAGREYLSGHFATPPMATPALVTQGKAGVPPCMACHGDKGQGDWESGYPRLAGLNAVYIVKQLQDFARNSLDVGVKTEPIARDYSKTPRIYKDLTIYSPGIRHDEMMAAIAKKLTMAEIAALGAYYAQLHFKATPQPVDFQTLERGRELAVRGKPEYMLPRCSVCHGPKGEGFGEIFPPLSGQPPQYLIGQINRWQRGERDNDHLSMMKNVANLLTDGDKVNIAAYYNNISYEINGE